MLKKLFASRKNPYVPGLDKPETLEINLSGSTFRIQLPPNSVADLPAELKGHTIDIYNRKHYADLSHLEDYQNSRLPHMLLFRRGIGLYGNLLKSDDLGMIAIYSSIRRVDSLPNEMSCLRPSQFEQVVLRDLYFSVGPACIDVDEKRAPEEWRIIQPQIGEQWVYCEAIKNFDVLEYHIDSYERASYEIFMFTPLDDQYYLRINFDVHGYAPVKYCNSAVYNILKPIVHSCELELSNTIAEQKLKLNKGTEELYSQTRNHENWTYHKWRRGDYRNNEMNTIITEFGTLPPKFYY